MLPKLLAAQPEYSLSGLLNFGPQANFLHPSYAPDGVVFVGLPVLSKVSILANNRFSYRDLGLSGKNPLDLLRKRNNSLGLEVGIGSFLFGFKSRNNHYASFFANERVKNFLYYPKDFLGLVWTGNSSLTGRSKSVGVLRAEVLAYREIGFGYSLPITNRLRVGAHLKYLIGLASLNMPDDAGFELQIDNDTYVHNLILKDWRIRASTLPLDTANVLNNPIETKDFLFPNNRGLALDLGLSYDISPLVNLSVSLRDLGAISWKHKTYSYTLEDSEFLIEGVDLTIDGLVDVPDSTKGDFKLKGEAMNYRSPLHYSVFSTLAWRLSRDNYLSVSHTLQRLPGSFPGKLRMYYSISYMRHLGRRFTASVSAIRYPQRLTLGMAVAYNFASFQLYSSMGNVLGLVDVPGIRVVDFNIGLNIITGRSFAKHDKNARLCP